MLHIGVILFAIGVFLISPLDEIFILIPLSAMFGLWIFPLSMTIALICLVVGGMIIGKHIMPILMNPLIILMLAVSAVIMIYLAYVEGWFSWMLDWI